MTWWAIDVRTPPERRERTSAWLVAHTGLTVEERDDGILVTFAEDEPAAAALIAALSVAEGAPVDAEWRQLEPVDWSTRWREGLGSRRFGRLTVRPSWIAEAGEPDAMAVVLDPENAFGSGEHGSTRAALVLLERHLCPGDRVLDLGSGSGILTIAAAKLGAARAIGIDTDAEANVVALRNAERNAVRDRVEFLEGDATHLTCLLAPADLVLSNILRMVNVALLPAIAAVLRPGGLGIFSGMEVSESALFRPKLAAAGLVVRDEVEDAGWWAVAAVRP
jgi:ribosomal protein L11 methyltransferase